MIREPATVSGDYPVCFGYGYQMRPMCPGCPAAEACGRISWPLSFAEVDRNLRTQESVEPKTPKEMHALLVRVAKAHLEAPAFDVPPSLSARVFSYLKHKHPELSMTAWVVAQLSVAQHYSRVLTPGWLLGGKALARYQMHVERCADSGVPITRVVDYAQEEMIADLSEYIARSIVSGELAPISEDSPDTVVSVLRGMDPPGMCVRVAAAALDIVSPGLSQRISVPGQWDWTAFVHFVSRVSRA